MMLSEPELYVRCSNILQPSYFDKKNSGAVGFMHQYSEKHNGLPSTTIVNAKLKTKYEQLGEIATSHKEWFLESIEDFCKRKAIEEAIIHGAELLEKGHYGDLEKMVKEATLVSLQRNMGTDYFADPRARLEKLKTMNGTLSTGWKVLDEAVYQIGYGELILFSAISGGGKSVAMQNVTLNFALQGLNVVYFTFELSEELVSKRLDSMLTGISNQNIFKNLDQVELSVKTAGKRAGKIFVKYLPPGSTPNDVKAYIREFMIQQDIKPDAIVVDYIDLMGANDRRVKADNVHLKDKLVAEALRAMCQPTDLNMVCVSAVQSNRTAYQETIPGLDTIAGGITKAQTADLMMHINITSQLKERGEMEFQLTKTRNSGGVGSIITMGYDKETLRITDPVNMEELKNNTTEVVDPVTGEITEVPNNAGTELKKILSRIKR